MNETTKIHPAAQAFPMMDKLRYGGLLEDIREHGLRVPIVLCEGMILDGRNRAKACAELGIEPRTEEYTGDPWQYVWSLNGQRRDIVADQRYLIWKFCEEHGAAWQAEKERLAEEANAKRKSQPREENGTFGTVEQQLVTSREERPTYAAKSEMFGTNRGAVARRDACATGGRRMSDKRFTAIAGNLLGDLRDLSLWGIEEGLTTMAELRLTIPARQEKAKELVASGLSLRQAAKALGVGKSTVDRDVSHDGTELVPERTTRELLSQSDQNDWRTPRKFLDAARAVLGNIDLDPATSARTAPA